MLASLIGLNAFHLLSMYNPAVLVYCVRTLGAMSGFHFVISAFWQLLRALLNRIVVIFIFFKSTTLVLTWYLLYVSGANVWLALVRPRWPWWLGNLSQRCWLHFWAGHLRDFQPCQRSYPGLPCPSACYGGDDHFSMAMLNLKNK